MSKKRYFVFHIIFSILLLLSVKIISAQTSKPAANDAGKSLSKTELERILKERRMEVTSLLVSLAADARSFSDHILRVRTLAGVADTLWETDSERGRAIFRDAWHSAEIADKENKNSENFRNQVLLLASKRDRLLGEEFLEKLKQSQEDLEDVKSSKPDPWRPSKASEQRLELAKRMLNSGNAESALQFADPVLGEVSISTLDFLTQLREHLPVDADRRYEMMLVNTNINALADVNTISLLSSYIFSPYKYVVFDEQGNSDSTWMSTPSTLPNITPQLRLAFFQTASRVLLRPVQDPINVKIVSEYMIFRRLLPFFETYAPSAMTEAMRSKFLVLNSMVNEQVRQSNDQWKRNGLRSEKQIANQEESLLEELDHTGTSAERDAIYFKLALLMVSKNDFKARDYVFKIAENEFRKRAEAWVDWELAVGAINKKAVEPALELARKGELTRIQRIWVLTRSAKLIAKSDAEKAVFLINDATAEARRISNDDSNKPSGLFAIANAQRLIDPAAVWEVVLEAIRAANSAEGFTGEGGEIYATMNTRSQILMKHEAVPDFDIRGIFSDLTDDDYDRTMQLASGFRSDILRSNVTITIARSVLNNKRVQTRKPRVTAK